jgi:hypothetical protein
MHTASRILAELSTGPAETLSAIDIPPVVGIEKSDFDTVYAQGA